MTLLNPLDQVVLMWQLATSLHILAVIFTSSIWRVCPRKLMKVQLSQGWFCYDGIGWKIILTKVTSFFKECLEKRWIIIQLSNVLQLTNSISIGWYFISNIFRLVHHCQIQNSWNYHDRITSPYRWTARGRQSHHLIDCRPHQGTSDQNLFCFVLFNWFPNTEMIFKNYTLYYILPFDEVNTLF